MNLSIVQFCQLRGAGLIKSKFSFGLVFSLLVVSRCFGDSLSSFGSTHNWQYDFWQTSDGLPHNDICALAQTPDGYIWVATLSRLDALVRFNGIDFIPLATDVEENVLGKTCLATGKNGKLWVSRASNTNPLILWQRGKVTPIDIQLPYSLHYSQMARRVPLYEDRNENLWIGGSSLLLRTPEGVIKDFHAELKPYGDIRQITGDQKGNLWLATEQGLVRYRDGVLDQPYPITNSIFGVYLSGDGSLWAGTDVFPPLFKVSPSGVVTEYGAAQGLDSRGAVAICEDKQNNIWVGTYSGLYQVLGDKAYRFQSTELKSAYISSLLCDQEGSLWVGTADGLYRLSRNPIEFYGVELGMTSISSLSTGPSGLWASVFAGGVYLQQSNVWSKRFEIGDPSGDCLVAETSSGDVWLSTELDCYRIAAGKVREAENIGGKACFCDDGQTLWIVNATNVFAFRAGRLSPMGDGWPAMEITCVATNQLQGLLIGTTRGLFKWDGRLVRWLELEKDVPGLRVSSLEWDGNTLWLATDKAIARYQQDQWQVIGPAAGLVKTGGINSMLVEENSLWLGCANGLFLINRSEAEQCLKRNLSRVVLIQYGRAQGIRSGYFGAGQWCQGAARGGDGKLSFASKSGVVTVNTKQLLNTERPRIFIESVLLDHQPVTNRFGLGQEIIKMAPGTENMEVHYAALSYIAPRQVVYKYRLVGLNSDWVTVGNSRVASFVKLSPGSYEFQVQARNADGVWNENSASVQLIQEPFFHQTRTFYVLCWLMGITVFLVLAAIATAIAHAASTRKMRRQMALLEAQRALEQERTRIARDIHDDIGSTLTSIVLLSELAVRDPSQTYTPDGHLAGIRETAREITRRLDEIVWAINPKNDTLSAFVTYVSKLVADQTRLAGLRCRLDLPKSLPAWTIKGSTRHHLYLACKEAVNNAIKHAVASQLQFRMTISDENIVIEISDNGVGLPAAGKDPNGDGLHNLRERLATLGGLCEVTGIPNQGTVVRLQVPQSKIEKPNEPLSTE